MALLVTSIIDTFTESGINAALIQRSGDNGSYYGSAWGISILRGVVLCCLACSLASPASVLLGNPSVIRLIKTMSLAFLIYGFTNPAITELQRILDFRRYQLFVLTGTIVEAASTVILALALKSVWALVLGALFAKCTGVVMSFVLAPCRPKLRIQKEHIRELLRYGKWIGASSALIFISGNLGDAVVARFCGSASLGLYQVGSRLSNVISQDIMGVFVTVMFPALGAIRSDTPRMQAAFLRSTELIYLVVSPLLLILFLQPEQVVNIVLGKRWLAAAPIARVFAVYGSIRILNAMIGTFFQAFGRPEINTRGTFISLAFLAMLLFISRGKYTLDGVGWTVTASAAVFLLHGIYCLTRFGISASRLSEVAYVPLCSSLFTVAIFAELHSAGTNLVSNSVPALITLPLLYCLCAYTMCRCTGRDVITDAFATTVSALFPKRSNP